jgi:ubiquitin carboxyl-terminal hydrolase 4/11/15
LAAEVFNHRFYKYLNDALPVTEVGDRDKLYFYELPTSSRQSPSYKPSPSDPLLLPVFNVLPKSSRATQRRGYYTSSYGGWDGREPYAIPFFVVLSAEAASTQRGIYTAVMARLQRWTTKRHDFFRWEPSDEDAAGKDQTTSVETTGREPLTPPPEGLDEDLPASSSQQIVSPSKPQAEEGEVEMGGVDGESSRPVDILDDIFKLWLHESPEEKLESGWNMESSGRLVEWEERERSPPSRLSKIPGGWNDSSDEIQTNLPPLSNGMPMPSPLVCASDALICEFESQYAVHFFGDGGKGAESLWDVWTKHVSPEFEAAKAAEALKRKKGISISDCLDEFTKEEKLGEDDLWYCPRCKKHQQATKKFEIWKLPDILVVHLKRFSNSRMLRDKIDDFVDFPIEGLDLGDRVGERLIAQELIAQGADPQEIGVDDTGEPLVYDLFAVDEHMGGLGGGHYRAYARNDADGEWYHFDDSYVTKTQASSAVVSC